MSSSTQFSLDVADIKTLLNSWEYPGQQTECNIVSGQDSANLLELLKELRASPKLPKASLLTAAVPLWTFIDPDGNPVRLLTIPSPIDNHAHLL